MPLKGTGHSIKLQPRYGWVSIFRCETPFPDPSTVANVASMACHDSELDQRHVPPRSNPSAKMTVAAICSETSTVLVTETMPVSITASIVTW